MALRIQITLAYAFAGFAKLNHGWIVNAAPLRFWLLPRDPTKLAVSWLST